MRPPKYQDSETSQVVAVRHLGGFSLLPVYTKRYESKCSFSFQVFGVEIKKKLVEIH